MPVVGLRISCGCCGLSGRDALPAVWPAAAALPSQGPAGPDPKLLRLSLGPTRNAARVLRSSREMLLHLRIDRREDTMTNARHVRSQPVHKDSERRASANATSQE